MTRFTFFLFFLLLPIQFAPGQNGPVPSRTYWAGEGYLLSGDVQSAVSFYEGELRVATRIASMRWIDSICCYSMLGESYYLAGDLPAALEHFNAAAGLYLEYTNWLDRVNFPVGAMTSQPTVVPWGPGNRQTPKSSFSSDAQMTLGDVPTADRLRQGGAISPMRQIPVNPLEILQTIALAVRRRSEILGPLAKFDPMSAQLLTSFSTRTVPKSHWSNPWLDVLFGIALESMGKDSDAIRILSAALLLNGEGDHSLTPTALLVLGKIHLKTVKPAEATVLFHEASISATKFDQYLIVEEALRNYSNAKLATGSEGNDDILVNAWQWSKSGNRARLLTISLGLELTEHFIYSRQYEKAESGLATIDRLFDNRGLRQSRFVDHYNYLSALLDYAQGRVSDGDNDLRSVVEGMRSRSLWLFQVDSLDQIGKRGGFTAGGAINLPNASDLYMELLRIPTAYDWATQPMDALAATVTIPADLYNRWFLILLERDLRDKAFEVAERIRMEQFYSHLPMGGRLLSLRIILDGSETIPDDVKLFRQELLVANPNLASLCRQLQETKAKLLDIPIVPQRDEDIKNQKTLLGQQLQLSSAIEAILSFLVAGRMAIPIIFPDQLPVPAIQSQLPPETSLLTFINIDGLVFGTMVTKDFLEIWKVGTANYLETAIAGYLKSLDLHDGMMTVKELDSAKSLVGGKKMLELLLGDRSTGGKRFSVLFKHLVVVPTGPLWYLPFETLALPNAQGDLIPWLLIPELTIRYAPVAGLAVPGKLGRMTLSKTMIARGQIYPKIPEKQTTDAIERLARSLQKAEIFEVGTGTAPSAMLAPLINQLVVWDEIPAAQQAVANWSPVIASKSRGNEIANWVALPWGAPRLLVLPGFRSGAENALKKAGMGEEFFVPMMILESQGTETILISRWRTGGRTTVDLLESFLKNSPTMPMTEAWKQAVVSLTSAKLVPEEEPKLRKPGASDKIPPADHPLFWAGYMLVDRGEAVKLPVSAPIIEEATDPATAPEETAEPIDPTPQPEEEPKPVTTLPEEPTPTPTTDSTGHRQPGKIVPITDDDLKREDEEADDFYSPNP